MVQWVPEYICDGGQQVVHSSDFKYKELSLSKPAFPFVLAVEVA
jgi:hypothetical protein